MVWVLAEWKFKGRPSLLGGASGAVAGLVGITPAAGLVDPTGALVIGAVTSLFCVWGVNGLKRLLKADDSMDVFGVHGIGGIVGGILTGLFNAKAMGGPGLDSAGMIPGQLLNQIEGIVLAIVWSAAVSFVALKIASVVTGGLRVDKDQERQGLDISTHGEQGYHH